MTKKGSYFRGRVICLVTVTYSVHVRPHQPALPPQVFFAPFFFLLSLGLLVTQALKLVSIPHRLFFFFLPSGQKFSSVIVLHHQLSQQRSSRSWGPSTQPKIRFFVVCEFFFLFLLVIISVTLTCYLLSVLFD